ncbi:13090_t:CDS:1, partial [Cetraspora pellucida]
WLTPLALILLTPLALLTLLVLLTLLALLTPLALLTRDCSQLLCLLKETCRFNIVVTSSYEEGG